MRVCSKVLVSQDSKFLLYLRAIHHWKQNTLGYFYHQVLVLFQSSDWYCHILSS